MEALGMSRIVVENGKVVEVSEPRLKYCPLFKKFRNIDEITSDAVRDNIEFRIDRFGFGTENRETRAEDYVTFGVSEILSTAMEQGAVEASVIVADGCGTAVVKEAAVIQGLCGRISGMVECSPIQRVLDAVGRENVLDPETTPIDQVKGAEKALAMGIGKFAVTVTCPEQARIIREKCGDKAIIAAVHTSCVSEEGARKFYDNCDIITACASRAIREIAYARDDVVIAGNKVQIIAVTDIGKKLVTDKLRSIGKEPWDGKTPTEDPRPFL